MLHSGGFPWRGGGQQQSARYASFHGPRLPVSRSLSSSSSASWSNPLSARGCRHSASLPRLSSSRRCRPRFHKPFALTLPLPPSSLDMKACSALESISPGSSTRSLARPCRFKRAGELIFDPSASCGTVGSSARQTEDSARSRLPFLVSSECRMGRGFCFSVLSCLKGNGDSRTCKTKRCLVSTDGEPFSSPHTSGISPPLPPLLSTSISPWRRSSSSLSRSNFQRTSVSTSYRRPPRSLERSVESAASSLFVSLSQHLPVSSTWSVSFCHVSVLNLAHLSPGVFSSCFSSLASSCFLSQCLSFRRPFCSLRSSNFLQPAAQIHQAHRAAMKDEVTSPEVRLFSNIGEAGKVRRGWCTASQRRRLWQLSSLEKTSRLRSKDRADGKERREVPDGPKRPFPRSTSGEGGERQIRQRGPRREAGKEQPEKDWSPRGAEENPDSSVVETLASSTAESSALPVSSSPSCSSPVVSASSPPAEKEEEQRTLPTCVQDTYIDLG